MHICFAWFCEIDPQAHLTESFELHDLMWRDSYSQQCSCLVCLSTIQTCIMMISLQAADHFECIGISGLFSAATRKCTLLFCIWLGQASYPVYIIMYIMRCQTAKHCIVCRSFQLKVDDLEGANYICRVVGLWDLISTADSYHKVMLVPPF